MCGVDMVDGGVEVNRLATGGEQGRSERGGGWR